MFSKNTHYNQHIPTVQYSVDDEKWKRFFVSIITEYSTVTWKNNQKPVYFSIVIILWIYRGL